MFFFFKQKTAYEMRISDCSSDVCSSDLIGGPAAGVGAGMLLAASLVVAVESRTGRSDALLLATVVATPAALWWHTTLPAARPRFWGAPALVWAPHAVGVLCKGPLVTLVVVLTVPALSSDERRVGKECGRTCTCSLPPH